MNSQQTISNRVGNCPLEQKICRALDNANIEYFTDYEGKVPEHLDFYIPKFDIHIEVKGAHTNRISKQTKRSKNIIVVQGDKAVEFLVLLILNDAQNKL